MFPQKIFHTVMVIFGQILLNILPLIFRALPNINAMMHCLRTFSIVRADIRGSKTYCYRKDSKLRKKKYTGTRNIFGGGASSTHILGSAPAVC